MRSTGFTDGYAAGHGRARTTSRSSDRDEFRGTERGEAALLTTSCASMRLALTMVERLARVEAATVLLEGEAGTGKTMLARLLHQLSRRRDRAFHRVDLGALDDALSGSDLFGHVSGAFTGAQSRRVGHFLSAQGGTLFLDELAKASRGIQQKLLHAIEYREIIPVGAERPVPIDVRIIAATNVDLAAAVERNEFLADLLPRFGHFRVLIPPLRDRAADIPGLTAHFVRRHAGAFGFDELPTIADDLSELLAEASWPGNVRELESAVQCLLLTAQGEPVLDASLCVGSLAYLRSDRRGSEPSLSAELIQCAIAEEGGCVSRAAKRLRVSRQTVYRYLRVARTA